MAPALMSTLAAGLIGAFCWRTWWSIGFAFAVPILVGLQSRRAWAARRHLRLLRGSVLAAGPRLRGVRCHKHWSRVRLHGSSQPFFLHSR